MPDLVVLVFTLLLLIAPHYCFKARVKHSRHSPLEACDCCKGNRKCFKKG